MANGFVSPQDEVEYNRIGRRRRSETVVYDYNLSHGETRRNEGSMRGRLLFLLFVNGLPDALETLTLLFADDAKMVTFTVLLLLHGTGQRNGTYRSILLNATISQWGEKFP